MRAGARFNELAQANSDSPTAKTGALDPYKKGTWHPPLRPPFGIKNAALRINQIPTGPLTCGWMSITKRVWRIESGTGDSESDARLAPQAACGLT